MDVCRYKICLSKILFQIEKRNFLFLSGYPGGGVLPYITYTGMCRPKGS